MVILYCKPAFSKKLKRKKGSEKQSWHIKKNLIERKQFLKTTGIAAAALAVAPLNNLLAGNNADAKLKVAMIGVGLRGQNHLNLLLKREDVDLVAVS